ncbi:flotillin family protein [soil metagenome]
MNIALIGGAGFIGLLVLIVLFVVSRYRVAGPNQAFIITGRKGAAPVKNPETGQISSDLSGQRVIIGASTFVLPVVQKLHILDLSSRRIPVGIGGAVSAQGIKVDLEGVAIVKVGGTEDAIRAASQRFLDQQQGIEVFTQEVLAGSLRAIVGRLTVDAIIKDRAAFAAAVAEEAETSLTNQGLALDTFQLQDIRAEGNYLADLGRPEAARVEKEASIAEAIARQASEQERLKAEEQIAIAERTLALKRAEIQAETDAAEADARAAGPIAQAAKDQDVIQAQELVAQRRAQLKDRELDTEVRKPADAARYQVEQQAEGRKIAALRDADGERGRRVALAEALQREGEAEAAAILARGQAEAEARQKNAEAFQGYNEAAVIELITAILPDIVRAASEPMSHIKDLTIVSTDGASKLVSTVAQNLEQSLAIGSGLTGVDLKSILSRLGGSGVLSDTEPLVDLRGSDEERSDHDHTDHEPTGQQ